jgi:D-threo-aldose 1-dehydrogenase
MAHDSIVTLRGGAQISKFGVGTATFGGLYESMSDEDSHEVVQAAINLGVRYFDTAPHYGKGQSELRLGRLLAGYPRNSYVLSTKVGRLLVPKAKIDEIDEDFADSDPLVERLFDFSEEGIIKSFEESLIRLGLESVDIVFIHDPDDYADQAIKFGYPALERLRTMGLIKSIGVGMNQVDIPARFVRETDIDVVLIAGRYTLLDQSAGIDLLPLAEEKGVSVIAAGVLNSGILANPGPGAHYDYVPASAQMIDRALALKTIFEGHGSSLSQAAMQFPCRNLAISGILVGCRTAKEVSENVSNFDDLVPQSAWDEFDAFIASSSLKMK